MRERENKLHWERGEGRFILLGLFIVIYIIKHTIRVLENRLNKATREFNTMLAQNSKLREDIQHLRNQRGMFNTIHKRLCKNLVGKKRAQVR